jgi:hypothetical protein
MPHHPKGNVLSKGDRVVASYLRIFMAYEKDKALEKNDKSEVLPSGVWSFHDKHRGMPMMKTLLKKHFFPNASLLTC